MRKLTFLLMLIAGSSLMFSCIDNDESDSIKKMREAMAKELESVAAYNDAAAQALLIAAQAEADYQAALASVQAAQAKLVLAQAANQEIKNAIDELELKKKEGALSAEIDALIAEAKVKAAKAAADLAEQQKALKKAQNDLEELELTHAKAIAEAELAYEKALLELKAHIAEVKAGTNATIAGLLTKYETAMKQVAADELQAAKDAVAIVQAEAELAYVTETQAIDKEVYVKGKAADVEGAKKTLDGKKKTLAKWEALEGDVTKAQEMIEEVEAEIAELKVDRNSTFTAWEEAKADLKEKKEAKEENEQNRAQGYETYDIVGGVLTPSGFRTNTYISLVNGETYQTRNTAEGVKSIITLAGADLVTLKADLEKTTADYKKAIAGIESQVKEDQDAYKNYKYAEEQWIAAEEKFTNGDITEADFLVVDKAYCVAYSAYWGEEFDTDNSVWCSGNAVGVDLYRPNGSAGYYFGTLNGTYTPVSPAYPGDPSDAALIAAFNAAKTAWENAYYLDLPDHKITAREMLAYDKAYCVAYAQLNGGDADGTESRPDGNNYFMVSNEAVHVGAETYTGTRSKYGTLLSDVDDLRDAVEGLEDDIAILTKEIEAMKELESLYGEYAALRKAYLEAVDTELKTKGEYKEVTDEISRLNDIKDKLENIRNIQKDGEPYETSIDDILAELDKAREEVDSAQEALDNAQADYDHAEYLFVEGKLTEDTILENMASKIEEKKAKLAILKESIEVEKAKADSLKASIDEMMK